MSISSSAKLTFFPFPLDRLYASAAAVINGLLVLFLKFLRNSSQSDFDELDFLAADFLAAGFLATAFLAVDFLAGARFATDFLRFFGGRGGGKSLLAYHAALAAFISAGPVSPLCFLAYALMNRLRSLGFRFFGAKADAIARLIPGVTL